MNSAAEQLDFERAARLRDDLGALKRALEKQAVVLGDGTDARWWPSPATTSRPPCRSSTSGAVGSGANAAGSWKSLLNPVSRPTARWWNSS